MTIVLLVVAFKCEQDKECADFAQGVTRSATVCRTVYLWSLSNASKTRSASIDDGSVQKVHDRDDAERDCLLCSLFVVAFKCEQDKECADFAQGVYIDVHDQAKP